MIGKLFLKLIGGTRNERLVRARMRFVRERINPLEGEFRAAVRAELEALGPEERLGLARRFAEWRVSAYPEELHAITVHVRKALPKEHTVADIQALLDKAVADRIAELMKGLGEAGIRDLAERQLSAQRVRRKSAELKQRMAKGAGREEVLPEAFALVREASRVARSHRQFDVQLVAGMILDEGKIAEEATGEGKTIACYPAIYMAALEGRKTHLVTTNDYLVRRDAEFASPVFALLGVTVGYITVGMDPRRRKPQYACDVTYGTNSEFGFDYLRDNMAEGVPAQVQGRLDFAIVDEADNILIDEARTPLIISGPAHEDTGLYAQADDVAVTIIKANRKWESANDRVEVLKRRIRALEGERGKSGADRQKIDRDIEKAQSDLAESEDRLAQEDKLLEVERDKKAVHLTHEGVSEANEAAQGGGGEAARRKADRRKSYRRQEWSLKRDIRTLEGKLKGTLSRGRAGEGPSDYELAQELRRKQAELDKLQKGRSRVKAIYGEADMEWPHRVQQALRARIVFEKDKDYVVLDGRVIIVDEFTGRLLEGRQWSDGLHQAVEAKERVPIKEETQTLATVTIQNYFRMYKKLAGMTGTAMTEANELMKIYKLDVVSVPTHRPVNRVDHNDRIYAPGEKNSRAPKYLRDELAKLYLASPAKYRAIAREIDEVSRAGRPVLVGTTSVEMSEMLSAMLTHEMGTEHQVLNGRPENAAREGEIVAFAGQRHPLKDDHKTLVGTVTIATNMAGRGTDIKLGPGVVYEKCKVPPPEELQRLGVAAEDLFPAGSTKCCLHCPQYDPATDCAHCFKPRVDDAFPVRGRTDCSEAVPCGLHIVGTERHEARRIDNQLRGRSGRQGDPGSGRFFLSLGDPLIAMFAPDWTLRVLGWLGLQGDTAIEDRRVSRGIERAQKKVEERNFDIRKNLLEYDEVMDFQRRAFYSQRQQILEGRQVEGLVLDMLRAAVRRAVETYLDRRYPAQSVAQWARQNLSPSIRDEAVRAEAGDDPANLIAELRETARQEIVEKYTTFLGEFDVEDDVEREDWNISGLSRWLMREFKRSLSQKQILDMSVQEMKDLVAQLAAEKAQARFDELSAESEKGQLRAEGPSADRAGEGREEARWSDVGEFLAPGYGRARLCDWAAAKFGIEVTPEEIADAAPDAVRELLTERVEAAYRRLEVETPVDYCLDMTVERLGMNDLPTLRNLASWARRKYGVELAPEQFLGKEVEEVREAMVKESEAWLHGGRLQETVQAEAARWEQAAAALSDPDRRRRKVQAEALRFARRRFDTRLRPADMDGDVPGAVVRAGRQFLRRELSELERAVVLRVYDTAWKDHMLAMDHLRSSISLRSFAERDPRVAFKIEGTKVFEETVATAQEKITDMIFKVGPQAGRQAGSVYHISEMVHRQLAGYDHLAREMGDQAGADSQKVQTIRRDPKRVGRNDPCPCGSGKKYKKCHGKGL